MRKITSILLFMPLVLLLSCATNAYDLYLGQEEFFAQDDLASMEETQNINKEFDTVYVTTRTQCLCKNYQFSLVNGKIWCKKANEDWQLFLTGIPYSKHKDFASPSCVISIACDADSLFALGSDRRIYHVFLYKATIEKPLVWYYDFGFPGGTSLRMNELVDYKRGWGVGVRRKDVLYHEDAFGNPHHWGTMGLETLYFLSPSGQEIRFTDSGLPPDFSRSILCPYSGAFVASNLCVSASTILVIDEAGDMFTRLIDFDTMGCDVIFFKYTYKYTPARYKGTQYRSNYSPWGLPSEEWRKQPCIALKGKARLTRHISILQDGTGNSARLLRVAGTNSEGNTGFYTKHIFDSVWNFQEAPLHFSESDFLHDIQTNASPLTTCYEGRLIIEGQEAKDIECNIPDWKMSSEGECTLSICDKSSGGKLDLTLYCVEMWTYLTRYNPGCDGTTKNFFATLKFNEDTLEAFPLLKPLFIGKNLEAFTCKIRATLDYIELTVPYKNKEAVLFFYAKDSTGTPLYTVEDLRSPILSASIELATSCHLILDKSHTYTASDIEYIKQVIKNNKDYQKLLQYQLVTAKKIKRSMARTRRAYTTVDIFTTLTLLNQLDFPKIKTITRFTGDILKVQSKEFLKSYTGYQWLYPQMINFLQRRIAHYEALLNNIATTGGTGKLPISVCNSFDEYLNFAGLPYSIYGKSPNFLSSSSLVRFTQIKEFCGYTLRTNTKDDSTLYLVELKDIDSAVEKWYLSGNELFSCTIMLYTIDKDVYDIVDKFSGKLSYDKKTLSITLDKKLNGSHTIFSSDNILQY